MSVACAVSIGFETSAAQKGVFWQTTMSSPWRHLQAFGARIAGGAPAKSMTNELAPGTVEQAEADASLPGVPLSTIYAGGSSSRNAVSGNQPVIEPYPPRGATVRDRARPELDALGLRAGGFLVYPEVGVTEYFDDNIFKQPSDTRSDFITRIAPRLRVESNWSVHALTFDVGGAIGLYAENPDENYEDFHARAAGRLDITRDSQLDGSLGFERLHSDRGSPDDADSLFPTVYYDLSGRVNFTRHFGDLTLRLGSAVKRLDYDNNSQLVDGVVEEVDNGDRDRYEVGGAVRLGYSISPNVETYLDAGYAVLRYDEKVDDDGFDRNARRHDATVGVALDFGGITSADLHVGYLAQDFDDDRLSSIVGPDVGGSLTWNMTGLTTVTASLERRIAVTTIEGASGSLVTEAGVAVDHELRRDLLVGLDATWLQNDYVGIDRIDSIYQIGLEMDYLVNRNLRVSAGYSYGQRDSNQPSDDYAQNLILLRIEAQY